MRAKVASIGFGVGSPRNNQVLIRYNINNEKEKK